MAFQRMLRRAQKPKQHWFTRVKNLEFDKDGTVDEFLETQFAVNYEDGSFGFLFYKDKGDTWRPLDEKKPTRKSKVTGARPGDFIQFLNTPTMTPITQLVEAVDLETIQAAQEAMNQLNTLEDALDDMLEEVPAEEIAFDPNE